VRRIAIGLVVCAIVTLVAWRAYRSTRRPPARPTTQRSSKIELDANAFRRFRDARVARAKELAAKRSGKRAPDKGLARIKIGDALIEEGCLLGTSETCHVLEELMADCDAEDAAACYAIGQFVVDNPPHSPIAIMLFVKACDLGDADACRYKERVQRATRCEDDPFECGWVALRSQDKAVFEDACTKGVADACASLTVMAEAAGDVDLSRAYLEQSCQLGSAPACEALAARLAADCEPHEIFGEEDRWTPCYAIDEAEATEARTIACEAGFGKGCRF